MNGLEVGGGGGGTEAAAAAVSIISIKGQKKQGKKGCFYIPVIPRIQPVADGGCYSPGLKRPAAGKRGIRDKRSTYAQQHVIDSFIDRFKWLE